ncbi:MAG: hypothetical protein V1724_01670 [Chloroflexota bacterium]
MQPCGGAGIQLTRRYAADLLQARRLRPVHESVEVGREGTDVVADGAEGGPLGHQPRSTAIGGRWDADFKYRATNWELQQVHRVASGAVGVTSLGRLQAALHALVLSKAEHLAPEAPRLPSAAARGAYVGHAGD